MVVSEFFFFNDTATTEIYTLSLHDALPILGELALDLNGPEVEGVAQAAQENSTTVIFGAPERVAARVANSAICVDRDRKSTRLNSSHANISYAVFCLKKKNTACSPSSAAHT